MQQIINFFIRNKVFILYALLLFVSISFTIQSHSYHSSKFVNSANWLSGGVYSSVDGINDYFHLREYNNQLIEENARLRSKLINSKIVYTDSLPADSTLNANFRIFNASVIKNSFDSEKNYLTIDKGETDGIKQDMGVITSNGIVGIIENTSGHYATVQSVLNTLSEINAELKNSNHFGTLQWNGKDHEIVQLVDISRVASVKAGDTVVTGGMSTIFPKGIPIGSVHDVSSDVSGNYHIINIQLFTDMTNIGHVYVIENLRKEEIQNLENLTNE